MRWIAQTVRRREPRESRAAVRPNEQTNRGKAISPPTSESFEGIGINAHVEIDTGAQGDARPASIVGDLYRTARTRSSSATYEFLERERERERCGPLRRRRVRTLGRSLSRDAAGEVYTL